MIVSDGKKKMPFYRWGTIKEGDIYPSVTIYTGVSTTYPLLPSHVSDGQLKLNGANGLTNAFLQYPPTQRGNVEIPIPK